MVIHLPGISPGHGAKSETARQQQALAQRQAQGYAQAKDTPDGQNVGQAGGPQGHGAAKPGRVLPRGPAGQLLHEIVFPRQEQGGQR